MQAPRNNRRRPQYQETEAHSEADASHRSRRQIGAHDDEEEGGSENESLLSKDSFTEYATGVVEEGEETDSDRRSVSSQEHRHGTIPEVEDEDGEERADYDSQGSTQQRRPNVASSVGETEQYNSPETSKARHQRNDSVHVDSPLSSMTSVSPLSKSYTSARLHQAWNDSEESPRTSLARSRPLTPFTTGNKQKERTNIVVGIRSRPLSDMELSMGEDDVWEYEPPNRIFERPEAGQLRPKEYIYDHVYPPSTETLNVYETMGVPIVDAALEGYNGTIFAYGQTSSGKTYTLMGTAEAPGMTVLAVHDVFRSIEQSRVDRCFEVRVSYVEIYNEELKDLLNPNAGNLKIVDHPITGPQVKGLTEEVVVSPSRVIELLDIGERNRKVAFTQLNENSSRSHTLFRMVIESWDPEEESKEQTSNKNSMRRAHTAFGGGFDSASFASTPPSKSSWKNFKRSPGKVPRSMRVSCLNLVDLAGSERVSKTRPTGTLLKESGRINASLLTLGTVISKLGQGREHIPYRDSKLTRLLSSSLGGNAKTGVICTISPAGWNRSETRSTLHFASRAQKVVNRAHINEISDKAGQIEAYKREIANLKASLLEARGGQLMTADGEVVTAEELISRMKDIQDERQHGLERQLEQETSLRQDLEEHNSCLHRCIVGACQAIGCLQHTPSVVRILVSLGMRQMSPEEGETELFNLIPGLGRQLSRKLNVLMSHSAHANVRSPSSISDASSDCETEDSRESTSSIADDQYIARDCPESESKISDCLKLIERTGFESWDGPFDKISPRGFISQINKICDFAVYHWNCLQREMERKQLISEENRSIARELLEWKYRGEQVSTETAVVSEQRRALEKRSQSQETTIEALRSDLDQAKSQLSRTNAARTEFEAEVRRLRGNLTSERESNKMKIQHLERRLEQANSTYSEFYSEASEQSGRIEAIREERDQAWEEVRMLKNQIGYKDVEIEDLHEEIQATKAASESVEYRAETLEQRLRETREQLDNLRASYSEIEHENYRLSHENEKLLSKEQEHSSTGQNYQDTLMRHQEEISDLRERLAACEQEKTSAERREEDLSEKVNEKDEEIRVATEELESERSRRIELESWLNDTIDELASSEQTHTSSKSHEVLLEQKNMQCEDLYMQNYRSQERVHSLSRDLEEREKELMDLLQQCEEMIQRQKTLEDHVETYKSEAQEYREALNKREEDVQHFRRDAEGHLRCMEEHFVSSCKDVRSGLAHLHVDRKDVQHELESVHDSINNDFVPRILQHLATQTQLVNGLKQERAAAQSDSERVISERDAYKHELELYRSNTDNQVESLQRDISKLKGEKESAEESEQACKARLNHVLNQLEKLDCRTNYPSDEEFFNGIEQTFTDLRTEMHKNKELYEDICSQYETLKTEVSQALADKEAVKQEKEECLQECIALREYKSKLESTEEDKKMLDKQKSEAEAKLSFLLEQLNESGYFLEVDSKDDSYFYESVRNESTNLYQHLTELAESTEELSREKESLSNQVHEAQRERKQEEEHKHQYYQEVESLRPYKAKFEASEKEKETETEWRRSQNEKLQHLLTLLQDVGYCIGVSTENQDFYDAVRKSIQSLDENVQKSESSYQRLLRQYEDVSSQLSKTVSRKEKEESEKWRYLKECEELRPCRTKLNSVVNKLQYVLNLKHIDLEEEPEKFDEHVHERIVKLRDELSSTEDSKHYLSQRVDTLESQLQDAEQGKHKAERSVDSYERDYAALKREKENMQRQYEEQKASLEESVRSLEKDLEEKSQSMTELQADLRNVQTELNEYKRHCQILESEVEKLRSGIQSVRKSNIKLSQQLSAARKQLYESKITNIRDQFDSIGSWVDTASAFNDNSDGFGHRTTAVVRSTGSMMDDNDTNHFSPPWSADALMNKHRHWGPNGGQRHFDHVQEAEGSHRNTGRLQPEELE